MAARPTHKAWLVDNKEDRNAARGSSGVKAFWHEAGALFAHQDGKGWDYLIPKGMSVGDRVVIREVAERPANESRRAPRNEPAGRR